jgi:hypothetical protein
MNLIELSKKCLSQLMEQTAKSQHLRSKSNGLISHSKKLMEYPPPCSRKQAKKEKPENRKRTNHHV